jgi:iron complex transport system substrate-binding protein
MSNPGRVSISSEVEALATIAVNAAFDVHRELGPGLLESAYEAAFACELELRNVRHQRQVPVPVHYKGKLIELGFRADVLLEGRLLVELKAVERVLPVHTAQVITYLKVTNLPLGLLINFNEVLIKDGLHRVLNLRHRVS